MQQLNTLRANKLDVDRAFVLVIDIQERLLPSIRHHERVLAVSRKLLDAVRVFELPVLATEQYPKGIGRTDASIGRCLEASGAKVVEKLTFSAWDEPAVREAILAIDRPQVILIGIEAHVCVQQTALDLISRDYDVFVCADAIGSRGRLDYEHSLERMRQEGAWVTTVESVLFELCNRCGTPEFKAMLEVIKEVPPADD
jgi:isochorismate hydrolase